MIDAPPRIVKWSRKFPCCGGYARFDWDPETHPPAYAFVRLCRNRHRWTITIEPLVHASAMTGRPVMRARWREG